MSTENVRRLFPRVPARSRPRASRRPRLEALEGRALLTTFVVNSMSDILNPAAGVVTLRSAIQQANSNPDVVHSNEIDLSQPGTYKITLPGANTGTNNSGAFAILSGGGNLTIKNTSGGAVTIDGNALDRVFDVNPGANPAASPQFYVAFDGLTIQNGKATSADSIGGSGGGIRVQGSATLVLTNDILINNTAGANGGGVAMLNETSTLPTLSISNTRFLTNTASAGSGGGVYGPGAGTISIVSNSQIQGNTAINGGGFENPGSNLTLVGSTISGNHAVGGNGGGLDLTNPAGSGLTIALNITNSLFSNNTAESAVSPPAAGTGNGGAIDHAAGTLNLTNSLFSGNLATGGGGGIYSGGPSLSVKQSTFTQNIAGGSRGVNNPNLTAGDGGGIDYAGTGTNAGGTGSQVVNSTFYSNSATGRGGAIADAGPGDLTLVNDTINANTSGTNGGGVALLGGASSGKLGVQNTILFLNINNSATGPDVYTSSGSAVNDLGGNLVGTVNQGNTGFGAGTLTSNPGLGLLTDNGGALVGDNIDGLASYQRVIPTEALSLNSPAIGKGVNSAAFQGVDERGFPRPATFALPSIGAVEPQLRPSIDYVLGSDNNVYTRPLDPTGTPVGGYYLPNARQSLDLAETRFGVGLAAGVETFVIGTDHQVYAETIDPSNNSRGFFATAFGAVQSIAAGTDKNGTPLLYAVGTDNQLYQLKFNPDGTPLSTSYTKAAYGDFASTVLTHDVNGLPLLYAQGKDGQVYGQKMDANGTTVGPVIKLNYGPVKNLIVGHDAFNTPELFVVGLDNGVYYLKLAPTGGLLGAIPPYQSVNGAQVKSITITSDASNNPELFVIGLDNQVYGHKFDASGTATGIFFHVNTAAVPGGVSSIYAGTDASNRPELFAISADPTNQQVYVAPFSASGDSTGGFTLVSSGKVKKVVLV